MPMSSTWKEQSRKVLVGKLDKANKETGIIALKFEESTKT